MIDERPDITTQTKSIQEVIIADVLKAILPIHMVLMLFNLLGALLSMGLSQPSRPATVLLALVLFLFAIFFVRKGQNRRAMWVMVIGLGVVVAFAALVNGGIRAPVINAVLLVVSLAAVAFGRHTGMIVSLLSTIFLWVIFSLQSLGLLREPPALAGLFPVTLMWSTFIWFVWSTVTVPQEKLREALDASFTREQELRQAQERTREADLAFKAIFDQAAHMMCLLTPKGEVLRLNRAALSLTDKGADALLGRPLEAAPWWSPAEGLALRQALDGLALNHNPVRLQTQLQDTTGQSRTIDLSLSPFMDEGALRYLIAEWRDVTEMMEAKERQERKQRLELVGQLAGGVAHDLNNVLAAILSSAELLKTDLSGESKELSQVIISSSHRARDLTRRLLTFARRTPIEKQLISVAALLEETIGLLARTLPTNIKIEQRLSPEKCSITGNSGALSSALLNLAVNARDAMPEGGTLSISTAIVRLEAEWFSARNETETPGDYIHIAVSDDGHGIPPHIQARIFEPFFSTKAEGSGLGLASVYGVIHDHRGVIEVSSKEGEGATFSLYLPLSKGDPSQDPSGELRVFEGKRALLVDDEPALLQVNSRLLARMGIGCVTAPDAEAGLIEFQKAPDSFDLAILDIALPGRRGTELAIDLLFASPKLRVLLVSGFQKEVNLDSLSSSRIRMLSKPFTRADLQENLAALLMGAPTSDDAGG